MFGLFNKRKPLTVKEIEDALYAGYLAFDKIHEPKQVEVLILDFKVKHSRACPKSLSLHPSVLHEDELYIFIWNYIFDHMASEGLRVNPEIFTPYAPLWEVLDAYIQRARKNFKMKPWLGGYWQVEDAGHIQKELLSECRDLIERLIFRSADEQKAIESNVDWHDAKEFSKGYSRTQENERITMAFETDPINWESSDDLLVVFSRIPANKTRIFARY